MKQLHRAWAVAVAVPAVTTVLAIAAAPADALTRCDPASSGTPAGDSITGRGGADLVCARSVFDAVHVAADDWSDRIFCAIVGDDRFDAGKFTVVEPNCDIVRRH